MPLAATHIIATTSLIGHFGEKFSKNGENQKYFVFLAAFGSLLPDIDIPLAWFLRSVGLVFAHGTVTHTLLFALIFLSVSAVFNAFHKKNISDAFSIFFFGILVHLVLDYALGGGAREGIAWFYPFSSATYKIHFLFLVPFGNTFEALDAIVLLAFFYANSRALLQIFRPKPLTKTE
ncbi:MAG: metal-dependent hydrolase [Candidatus Paceibacterota bacterium]|jgi:hypothetical protein